MVVASLSRADTALLIALVSLSWQMYHALRIDTARVRVSVDALVIPGPPLREVVAVKVVNTGRRPTQLLSLWLMFGKPSRGFRRLIPKRLRPNIGLLMYETEWQAVNAGLPRQLDVGQEATAFYTKSLVVRRAKEHGDKWFFGSASTSTAKGGYSAPNSVASLQTAPKRRASR